MKHNHPNSFKAKECQLCKIEAAAPDMLEALKDVDKFYQDNFNIMPVAFQTIANIIESAIAKAEEVQP